jgi:hypothetical protein
MLTRRVELRSPVPPDHQATPYPTHLPAPRHIECWTWICLAAGPHNNNFFLCHYTPMPSDAVFLHFFRRKSFKLSLKFSEINKMHLDFKLITLTFYAIL